MSSVPHSTQDHLPIAGIQDGALIMTDGSIRAVLKVEPINFELKSENEQNAIIYSYQSFLNSLDIPIQIVIQSKRLDLEQYLVRMQETQKQQTNDLLRIQTEDYIGFVRRLISVANIMAKRFYVVVSHSLVTKNSSISQITSLIPHKPTGPLLDQDEFDRLRSEVYNKANIIAGGLGRLGAKARPMETQELIELFYAIYNPDVATEERLTALTDLSGGVVTSPQAAAIAVENSLRALVEGPLPTDQLLPEDVGIAPVPTPPPATAPESASPADQPLPEETQPPA